MYGNISEVRKYAITSRGEVNMSYAGTYWAFCTKILSCIGLTWDMKYLMWTCRFYVKNRLIDIAGWRVGMQTKTECWKILVEIFGTR